jgi:hypothetical protein
MVFDPRGRAWPGKGRRAHEGRLVHLFDDLTASPSHLVAFAHLPGTTGRSRSRRASATSCSRTALPSRPRRDKVFVSDERGDAALGKGGLSAASMANDGVCARAASAKKATPVGMSRDCILAPQHRTRWDQGDWRKDDGIVPAHVRRHLSTPRPSRQGCAASRAKWISHGLSVISAVIAFTSTRGQPSRARVNHLSPAHT